MRVERQRPWVHALRPARPVALCAGEQGLAFRGDQNTVCVWCAKRKRKKATNWCCRYHSVRIDPVHYCKLEAVLAERRKKTKRFDRNGIPEDVALARLRLLRRTVRDDPTRIGGTMQFLKTPYQIRESCYVELAQTIAVLPNLKYVDLPEGMFSDEPAYATLRLEVQARCPNIRKTTYMGGAEGSFEMLAQGQIWTHLEVLELNRLHVDPMVLRQVLSSLPNLRALKVAETHSLSDEVLVADENLPPLPALEELVIKDTPRLTAAGLVEYLSWYETQENLRVLMLKDTGIAPWRLQEVLAMAPQLRTLAVQSRVSDSFPTDKNVQLLQHKRLRTLRYEITAAPRAGPYATHGYHSYLASSILSGGLPRLRKLFVLDEKLPDQLQNLPPPGASFAASRTRTLSNGSSNMAPPALRISPPPPGKPLPPSPLSPPRMPLSPGRNASRFSSNNPFAQPVPSPAQPQPQPQPHMLPKQTLEIFTKTDENGKWNFSRVDSFTGGQASASRRPQSGYGLAADVAGQDWDGGEARRSVMIRDAATGFLAVPPGAGLGSVGKDWV